MKLHRSLLVLVAACGTSHPATPATTSKPTDSQTPTPPASTAPGKLVTRTFHSNALGVDKHYRVYLPGGYDDAPKRRWPVLYYLHGLSGDEASWIQYGDLATAADDLHLQAIIVMPDGDASFYADSATPADLKACLADHPPFSPREAPADYCVAHADYEQYMTKDLIADVDATYRTIADRRGRGIAGFSMGGFGALVLSMRHEDLWSAAASHSGVDALLYAGPHPYAQGKAQLTDDVAHWGAQVEPIGALVRGIFGKDLANWKAHDPATLAQQLHDGDLALYLDCGTEDDFYLEDGASYLHDLLDARGVKHTFFLGPGKHDFAFWKPREKVSLAWFTDQLARPTDE